MAQEMTYTTQVKVNALQVEGGALKSVLREWDAVRAE